MAGSISAATVGAVFKSESEMGFSSGEIEAGSTVPSCSGIMIKSSIMPE